MVPRSRCSFLKTLVAENCSGSSLEEQFGVLQNYDDFYNAFDIVTAPFQHLNYEVTLHLMTHNWKSNATLCILMPLSVIFLENIGYLPTLLSNACPGLWFNAVPPSSGRPALCLFALLAFFAILTMQRDHLQAVTTFVCCFPRAWIAAFVSRQKINSGLALREFGLFPSRKSILFTNVKWPFINPRNTNFWVSKKRPNETKWDPNYNFPKEKKLGSHTFSNGEKQ